MTANKDAELLSKLFEERAKKAGLPYTLAETQAAGSFAAWQLLEAAVTATKSLDDKALAGRPNANTVETAMGQVEFGGGHNSQPEQGKGKQIPNGRGAIRWA